MENADRHELVGDQDPAFAALTPIESPLIAAYDAPTIASRS
jgi:hypothetical protein